MDLFKISIILGLSQLIMCRDSKIRKAHFTRLDGQCRGRKGILITQTFDGVKVTGNKMTLNTTITVKKDFDEAPTLKVQLHRCKSKDNPDTCESFHGFTTTKICDFLDHNRGAWKDLFDKIQPFYACPMKKGVYKMINGQIDITAFLLFPTDGWFWKIEAHMYDSRNQTEVMCIFIEVDISLKPVK